MPNFLFLDLVKGKYMLETFFATFNFPENASHYVQRSSK